METGHFLKQGSIHRWGSSAAPALPITQLSQGSVIAHVSSPIENYVRVRANFEQLGAELTCDGLPVIGVEPGDWILIDMEATGWSRLNAADAARLRDRCTEKGLQHVLAYFLRTPMLEGAATLDVELQSAKDKACSAGLIQALQEEVKAKEAFVHEESPPSTSALRRPRRTLHR